MQTKANIVELIFQLSGAIALLQFEEANPGTAQATSEQIRGIIANVALRLNLLHSDELFLCATLSPSNLSDAITDAVKLKYPNFIPVASLAISATLRLLYRGSNVEDDDVTEMMALELTSKIESAKIGISEDDFWAWHKQQFQEGANPQIVFKKLEDLVLANFRFDKKIFLSYRTSDTQLIVGRVSDWLTNAGFTVFYDKEKLAPGEKWPDRIQEEVSISDVVIILVGTEWHIERLFDEKDVVKFEILQAISQDKIVVPLLVNRAKMPEREDLPDCISRFTEYHAAEIEAGVNFEHQIEELINCVHSLIRGIPK